MSDLLDWAEETGLENLKAHHQTADLLQKQAVTTLTVLLAGATGGLAYAIKGAEYGSLWWAIGSAAFSFYLYLLCALTVFKTLTVKEFPMLHNEPRNLYQPEYSLNSIKEVEIENIQERIQQAVARNKLTAGWLNRIRYAAVASPLVFLITAVLVVLALSSGPAVVEEHAASGVQLKPVWAAALLA